MKINDGSICGSFSLSIEAYRFLDFKTENLHSNPCDGMMWSRYWLQTWSLTFAHDSRKGYQKNGNVVKSSSCSKSDTSILSQLSSLSHCCDVKIKVESQRISVFMSWQSLHVHVRFRRLDNTTQESTCICVCVKPSCKVARTRPLVSSFSTPKLVLTIYFFDLFSSLLRIYRVWPMVELSSSPKWTVLERSFFKAEDMALHILICKLLPIR